MNDGKVKIVVVNDCSHVFEDLAPFLEDSFDVSWIRRTRGLWSKTFGLLWKVNRSENDAVYHVNYGLQDAYLVSKFRHLDVLECHGSDIRWTLHTRRYGWIVRSNLRKAKRVLYSTPDMTEEMHHLRKDAEWLPTPVRTDLFQPKTCYGHKAVYFPKDYEELPSVLPKLLEKHGFSLTVQRQPVPYAEMPKFLAEFDVLVDRFTIASYSKTCLEAKACGLGTIDYQHLNILEERAKVLADQDHLQTVGYEARQFVEQHHDARFVAEKLKKVWREASQ